MPNSRLFAIVAGTIGIALTLAQYVAPTWPGYHEWEYTVALAIACTFLIAYIRSARKRDGNLGARLAIAAAGAFVIVASGIGSGLLGPDTRTIRSSPGAVTPLPDVGAAAFFPIEDAAGIGRGDAELLIRRRDAEAIAIPPGSRRYVGATALEATPELAAYVEARDAGGGHLTITQPTNASFLSPVLFFPQRVTIAGKSLAADGFATPAQRKQLKAFYFPKDAIGEGAAMHGVTGPAVLFAVDDESGRLVPGGIGFDPSGKEIALGGLHLRATIGTYPALVVSAVPYPIAVGIGFVLLLGGIGYASVRKRES